MQALDEAIFLKPTDSTAWYLRGAYHFLTGDRQLAARDLGRAHALEKKFEAAPGGTEQLAPTVPRGAAGFDRRGSERAMMVTMDQSREAGMPARALLRVVGDLVVAAVLALVLGVVYLIDSRGVQAPSVPPSLPESAGVPPPPPEPPPPPPPPSRKVDSTPRVVVDTTPDGRFGLVSLTGNPDDPSDDDKQLTFSRHGETNNTRVMVDGGAPVFGDSQGETVESWHSELDGSMIIVWSYRQVLVREAVRLVPGDLSDRIDTMRVTYALKNTGSTAHEVGIRVMLDTLIGGNDGVPFIVPGRDGMVTGPLVMPRARCARFRAIARARGPQEPWRDR